MGRCRHHEITAGIFDVAGEQAFTLGMDRLNRLLAQMNIHDRQPAAQLGIDKSA